MSKSLLEKSRAINRILQKIAGHPVNFFEIADVLCRNLECTVYSGRRATEVMFCRRAMPGDTAVDCIERFSESFNQELLNILETKPT